MGGWFTSKEHKTRGDDSYIKKIGKTHTDTYHVDSSNKRDQSHSSDLKVFGPKFEPSMKDIHHPADKK